nr:MAG TPA: zinc-ribbon containing domain protein [Caudoviricetes sp.]
MNTIIENVALSLFSDIRKETEKKQAKALLDYCKEAFGKAVDFKALPKDAAAALIESKRGEWEEKQEGKKCPYCGKFHTGENIPCKECSPQLIEIVKSYAEYEKSLKGDFAKQNAQWLRADLDLLYGERDSRDISSREGNITKISRVLTSMYEALDDSQKTAFWESVKSAVVDNNEKPSESGFMAFLNK